MFGTITSITIITTIVDCLEAGWLWNYRADENRVTGRVMFFWLDSSRAGFRWGARPMPCSDCTARRGPEASLGPRAVALQAVRSLLL